MYLQVSDFNIDILHNTYCILKWSKTSETSYPPSCDVGSIGDIVLVAVDVHET